MVFEARKAARGDVDLHFHAIHASRQTSRSGIDRAHFYAIAITGMVDDAFAQRKADGEILQIQRRAHHHGVRDTVEDQRNGYFIGQYA